ncbi:MAG: purine-nucleoside phosphorylase [Bacteroidota bacterium]|nr:purine-nucleoside phosphorylase [Bacteroidota bacterium]
MTSEREPFAALDRRFECGSRFLREWVGGSVDVAVVFGSGLGKAAQVLNGQRAIPVGRVPGYPQGRVHGHEGMIRFATLHGHRTLIFLGRIHGYEGFDAVDCAAPIFIAAALGARTAILTNAAGGIHALWRTGTFLYIDDFVVLPMAQRMGGPLSILGDARAASRLPGRSRMRELAFDAAREIGVPLHSGVYGYCSGPSYETDAEIRFLRLIGIDAVGMSTVPEILAAAAHGMESASISCITNVAKPGSGSTSHEDITTVAARAAEDIGRLIHAMIARLRA